MTVAVFLDFVLQLQIEIYDTFLKIYIHNL